MLNQRDNLQRESGTFLQEMDQLFNPFRDGADAKSVFFIQGNKIDKTYYYDHQLREAKVHEVIAEHYYNYFDIIAYYGLIQGKPHQGLHLIKGADVYEEIARENFLEETSPQKVQPQQSSNALMDSYLDDLFNDFQGIREDVVKQQEKSREPKQLEVGQVIETFNDKWFAQSDVKTLLIMGDITRWVAQLFSNNRMNYKLIQTISNWCSDAWFKRNGHLCVVLSPHPITSESNGNWRTLYDEWLTKLYAESILLHSHTPKEIEHYLLLSHYEHSQPQNKQLPFQYDDIEEMAYRLAQYGRETDQFDISYLSNLISNPHYWHREYARVKQMSSVPTKRETFATQIYMPEVMERLLKPVQQILNNIRKQNLRHQAMLLYGPPGTGKTSFVRLIAAEFNFEVVIADVASPYIDGSAEKIQRHFNNARELHRQSGRPVIIFLDELEKFKNIENSTGNSASALNSRVQALKDQMEGAALNEGLLIVGGSNDPTINRALAERFLPKILVPRPGPTEIFRFLQVHLTTEGIDPNLNIDQLVDDFFQRQFSFRLLAKLIHDNIVPRIENDEIVDRDTILRDTIPMMIDGAEYNYDDLTRQQYQDWEVAHRDDSEALATLNKQIQRIRDLSRSINR